MSFKPESNFTGGGSNIPASEFTFVQPEPEEGLRFVSTSLIVDIGVQKRAPYTKNENGKEVLDEQGNPIWVTPQPTRQVCAYVDLLGDEWDYGDEIGVQQIRLPLHDEWAGNIKNGINFVDVAPRDDKGNYIQGRPWTMHPANKLSKIAKACGQQVILEAGGFGADANPHKSDISLLLNQPFMMEATVNKVKKEKDGKEVEYVNAFVKNPVKPMKGLPVPPMKAKPLAITFDSPVEEIMGALTVIRPSVKRKIMQALNYSDANYTQEMAEIKKAEKNGTEYTRKPPVDSNMKIAFMRAGINEQGYPQEAPESDSTPVKDEGSAKPKATRKAAPKAKEEPVEDDPFGEEEEDKF